MDVIQLIVSILAAFPDAPVVISVSSRYGVERVRRRLREASIDLDKETVTFFGDSIRRIEVGTPHDLAEHSVEFNKRAIVIFPVASDAFHRRSQDRLLGPDRFYRIVGFIPVDARFAPFERFLQAGIFGADEIIVPWHRYVRRDVFYTQKVVNSAAKPMLEPEIQRDRQVAYGVRDVSFQLSEASRVLGLSPRLVVACAGITQALRLLEFLPEFRLFVSRDMDIQGLPPVLRQRLDGVPGRFLAPSAYEIATVASMPLYGGSSPSDAQSIVWVGDGPVVPDVVRDAFDVCVTEIDQRIPPGVLVDLIDRVDVGRRSWAIQRKRSVAKAGMLLTKSQSPIVARGLKLLRDLGVIS